MKWIGLTGGIATGKSTVARLVESRGYPVIDADQISHELTQIGNPGYQQILNHFGENILNESLKIDRKKLGDLIFNSKSEKKALEDILHPLIQAEVLEIKSAYEMKRSPVLFYDVPLLYEKNQQAQFDAVVVVWCQPEIQLHRLMERNNLTESEALSRIKAQMPMSHKISQASYCIDNSGSEYEIIFAVDYFLKTFKLS